jgi:hypothetical protein
MVFAFGILFVASAGFAVGQQDQPEIKLTRKEKIQVVDSIRKFMTDKYVFPDLGKKMGELVTKNM